MKISRYITAAICFLFLGFLIASAQATNAPAGAGEPSNTTAADIAKVLQDFGVHVNLSTLGSLLFLLYYAAKVIRNKTALGQTAFGRILAGILNAEATPPASNPPSSIGRPTSLILIFLGLSLCFGQARAQTNETRLDQVLELAGMPPTNYAIEPYFTYAPKAPEKYGGGVLAIYNVNDYVGLDLGLDWLGHLSLVSGNVQLQLPFHPLPKQFPSFIASPFVLGGIATAYGGAGKFNGSLSTVHDVGACVKFGHVGGGAFNTGVAWGAWDGLGAYDVKRYHVFAGYIHGF